MTTTIEKVCAGNIVAAAQLMRDLDDQMPHAILGMKELYRHTGKAYVIGITGNPGAGKSTVVDALISKFRLNDLKVGVVAVDPTSPFSGGAILGDRIRMQRHASDPGVFIRSLATRGQLGGLSRSTFDVVSVLDAMGYDRVLIETVGVGQDEVDVMKAAHTSVVVTVPGLGDDIQAIKAGILEIADVLLVNKSDREGADRAVRDLIHMLDLRGVDGNNEVPILKSIATKGIRPESGIGELVELLEAQIGHTKDSKRALRRASAHLSELIKARIADRARDLIQRQSSFDEIAGQIASRELDPYTAVESIVSSL